MNNHLKTTEWFPAGSNIVFYGYPGSERTNVFIKIALKLKHKFKIPITIVSCDTYHIGKSDIIERFASVIKVPFYKIDMEKLAAVQDDNLLIYLQFDERYFFSEENNLFIDLKPKYIFQNESFKKVLVLDCTHKDEINDALIESIGKDFIDAIILTKLDMVTDKDSVYKYLSSINIPVAFISYGEPLHKDGTFVNNAVISKIFERQYK